MLCSVPNCVSVVPFMVLGLHPNSFASLTIPQWIVRICYADLTCSASHFLFLFSSLSSYFLLRRLLLGCFHVFRHTALSPCHFHFLHNSLCAVVCRIRLRLWWNVSHKQNASVDIDTVNIIKSEWSTCCCCCFLWNRCRRRRHCRRHLRHCENWYIHEHDDAICSSYQ